MGVKGVDALRGVLSGFGIEFYEGGEHECERHEYDEWPGQWEVISSPYRFVILAGGEQGGKSVILAGRILRDILKAEKGSRARLYWLVGANYQETEREFGYLGEWLGKLALLGKDSPTKRVDPGEIRLKDGTRIVTKSDQDPRTAYTREAPDGIAVCEASLLGAASIERLRARAAPGGGWMMLAGTFEVGSGTYQTLYTSWASGWEDKKSYRIPSWANVHLYKGGRHDPEILAYEADASEDGFMERIAGKPVPPKGLVFSEFRKPVHVRPVEYREGLPVWIGIDPGIRSAYAVSVYQQQGGWEAGIDEVYERDLGTPEIIEICQNRPWWKDVKDGVIDISAKKREIVGPETVHDVWLKKTGIYLRANRVPIHTGTERLKSLLKPHPVTGKPGVVWNQRCRGILSEFGAEPNPIDGELRPYRWKLDKDGARVGGEPEDLYNHAVKASIYLFTHKYGSPHLRGDKFFKVVRY